MKLNALEDLFVRELSELYGSEKLILKAIPKMIKAAAHPSLRQALTDHKTETKDQIARLERIFKLLGEEPQKLKSYPVTGAILQGDDLIHSKESDADVRDAALLSTAQKVEHYEIASYGAVHTHAALLGYEEAASELAVSLKEEHEMDARLTAIAKESVNLDAARAPYGRARTGKRALAKEHSSPESGSAGRLLVGLSIGAALAIFLGSASWRKGKSTVYNSAGENI
jgi:ferritin-like metal-binding protein YciE